jgi:hypothetical protein
MGDSKKSFFIDTTIRASRYLQLPRRGSSPLLPSDSPPAIGGSPFEKPVFHKAVRIRVRETRASSSKLIRDVQAGSESAPGRNTRDDFSLGTVEMEVFTAGLNRIKGGSVACLPGPVRIPDFSILVIFRGRTPAGEDSPP